MKEEYGCSYFWDGLRWTILFDPQQKKLFLYTGKIETLRDLIEEMIKCLFELNKKEDVVLEKIFTQEAVIEDETDHGFYCKLI